MYQPHFGLNDRPFAFAPNPEHYYPAASIEQAREVIALNIERSAGVTLLVGPIGSGKTLLCQLIANQFAGELPVCLVLGSRMRTRTSLLQAILHGLGLPFRGQDESELRLTLSDHVSGRACHNGALLIIDEADRLPLELLEELRGLTNLVTDGQPQVRLMLAGAHRLEERVGHPKLESLNQRIVGRLFLDNFSCDETADYIRARINACGGDASSVFSDEALETVYRATNGVPRLINQICDHALLIASVQQVDRLDKASIEEAWADLQQLPLPTSTQPISQRDSADDGVVEYGLLDDTGEVNDPAGQLDTIQRVVAELDSESGTTAGESDSTSFEGDTHDDSLPVGEHDPKAPFLGQDSTEVQLDGENASTPDQEVDRQLTNDAQQEGQQQDSNELTMDQAANPFDEVFVDEEIVIQQFDSPSKLAREGHDNVTSAYSQRLATQLTAAHPGLRMHPAKDDDAEDRGFDPAENANARFQPLSAYLEDPSDAGDLEIGPTDDISIERGEDGVLGGSDHEFDPRADPVLPEHGMDTPAGSVLLQPEDAAMLANVPEYEVNYGNPSEIAVIIQDHVEIDLESAPSIERQQIRTDDVPPSSQTTSDRPPVNRKFRSLFSKMRRT